MVRLMIRIFTPTREIKEESECDVIVENKCRIHIRESGVYIAVKTKNGWQECYDTCYDDEIERHDLFTPEPEMATQKTEKMDEELKRAILIHLQAMRKHLPRNEKEVEFHMYEIGQHLGFSPKEINKGEDYVSSNESGT